MKIERSKGLCRLSFEESDSREHLENFSWVELDFPDGEKIRISFFGRMLIILFFDWKINSVMEWVPTFKEKVGLEREKPGELRGLEDTSRKGKAHRRFFVSGLKIRIPGLGLAPG